MHTCVHVCKYMCMCTQIQYFIIQSLGLLNLGLLYRHISVYTHICVYTYSLKCMYADIHIHDIHVYIYIHIYIYIYMCVCVPICMYECVYIYIYIYMYIYIYISTVCRYASGFRACGLRYTWIYCTDRTLSLHPARITIYYARMRRMLMRLVNAIGKPAAHSDPHT